MPKYQIRFCDSKGHGSFTYFDAENEVEKKAAEVATDYINKSKELRKGNIFRQPYKPKRVVHVWEMDMETKEPKKKGHRFKLELFYTVATYANGGKVRDEWYEPIDIS